MQKMVGEMLLCVHRLKSKISFRGYYTAELFIVVDSNGNPNWTLSHREEEAVVYFLQHPDIAKVVTRRYWGNDNYHDSILDTVRNSYSIYDNLPVLTKKLFARLKKNFLSEIKPGIYAYNANKDPVERFRKSRKFSIPGYRCRKQLRIDAANRQRSYLEERNYREVKNLEKEHQELLVKMRLEKRAKLSEKKRNKKYNRAAIKNREQHEQDYIWW